MKRTSGNIKLLVEGKELVRKAPDCTKKKMKTQFLRKLPSNEFWKTLQN